MLDWSLLGEFYSLFILFTLFSRYHWYERDVVHTGSRKLFSCCLLMSMGNILLNILCVFVLEHPGLLPVWANLAVNSLYFLFMILVCSMYGYLLFDAMLEHVYDKHCLRRATIMLLTVTGVSVLLLVINLFSGLIFSISPGGDYLRGPINFIYYLLPLVELVFLAICYVRNRSSVGDRMLYVMRSLPPIMLILTLLQFLYPNVMLNGTICAVISLIIFIAFRSHTVERDSLTGAGSRKAFIDELNLRCATDQSMQLIQVCILNLSDINLRYGHTMGNALLYEVARHCRRTYAEGRVFRTGSTAFTLALPYESDNAADAHLQALEKRLQEDWVLGEMTCQLTFSLAELRVQDPDYTASQLVERLEYSTALSKEKQLAVRFDRDAEQKFKRRSALIDLIRRSIQEDRFQVHYQPFYCCHHDLFCSAEALLRLNDDDGSPVPPSVFIPLAEETGLIDQLTWIVLDKVCRLLSRNDLPGLESVSMNLSMQQFLDPRLPQQILSYLDRYQVPPTRLRVEITERFILHDAQYAKKQLSALDALGIQIYMDDFGTGYSNLSSILQFPFAVVKLDRSLIAPMANNPHAALMVSTLIRLFGDLNKKVVAEGVEEEHQVQYLREKGIDMIQGFYYARPMPEDQLAGYFDGNSCCK